MIFPEGLRLIEKNWIGREAMVSAVRRTQAKAQEICKAVSSLTDFVVILPVDGVRFCVPASRRVPLPVKKLMNERSKMPPVCFPTDNCR
jgi:mitochondrial fission protein ELM1